MTGKELLKSLDSQKAADLFTGLYGKESIDAARKRYCRLIEEFLSIGVNKPGAFPSPDFPETAGEIRVFSVPGRTELGGNHTDHNQGKVLAGSIQLDAAAVVAPRQDKKVFFRSVGHPDVKVDISDLSLRENEKGTTEALIRGVAADFTAQGTPVYGFTANAANEVLTGSGLSSSAAIEILIAKIFDNLYCGGRRSALDLAKTGQKAENIYFGKPCGLMDQTACASGGAVAIDFGDLRNPLVSRIDFDPAASGFALCVVNTKGSHADLTPDYAAIPAEMKGAASVFGKSVLRELDEETLMKKLAEVRKAHGDRAILRAFHFFSENRRVDAMLAELETMNAGNGNRERAMENFLSLARESGDSSWELLQNIYSLKNPREQGIGLALALTKNFLIGKNSKDVFDGSYQGACRVHGGGFAGTIQAYLPASYLDEYRSLMEGVFGKGTLTVLKIRSRGAVELEF